MGEREPTLRDVLGAINELRGEVGEVSGWTELTAARNGLTGDVDREGVLVGFERSSYDDLRILQRNGSVKSRRGRIEAGFGRVGVWLP